MNITDFFSNIIGVKLTNQVWSWGAFDQTNNRVFLKIHELDFDAVFEGWVTVYDPTWRSSRGHQERLRHLEFVKQGAKCFAVIRRDKADFNSDVFVQLSDIESEADGMIYAKIGKTIPINEVLRSNSKSSIDDILDVIKSGITETEKKRLVAARIGQGEFRDRVLDKWGRKCALTGVAEERVIRASHIKPWRDSSNNERLDPNNGLPLVATVDALFDANLISFGKNGRIQISKKLSDSDREKIGIKPEMRLSRQPSKAQQEYLSQHRLADD